MEQARADEATLREIFCLLNGNEWDDDTLEGVASLIGKAGFHIAEVNEASSPDRETTPGHGDCACRECGIREIAARDYVRYPLHGRP